MTTSSNEMRCICTCGLTGGDGDTVDTNKFRQVFAVFSRKRRRSSSFFSIRAIAVIVRYCSGLIVSLARLPSSNIPSIRSVARHSSRRASMYERLV